VEALRRQVSRLSDSSLQPRTALSSGGTSALEGGMTELNDAIQRLETRMSQFSGEVTRNEARLQNRVGQLEALTPANLPDLLEGKADSDVVLDLRTRLASLEENDIARSAYSAAQAVALANLSRASQDTGSFLPEFNAVSRVVPDQEELLASVREYAAQGLPSLGMLRNRFDDTARDIVRAHRAESGSNFLTRLFANLMASITVRPTGRIERRCGLHHKLLDNRVVGCRRTALVKKPKPGPSLLPFGPRIEKHAEAETPVRFAVAVHLDAQVFLAAGRIASDDVVREAFAQMSSKTIGNQLTEPMHGDFRIRNGAHPHPAHFGFRTPLDDRRQRRLRHRPATIVSARRAFQPQPILEFPIPDVETLSGLEFFAQWFVSDPSLTETTGVYSTEGLRILVL